MKATTPLKSLSDSANGGIPFSGRPLLSTGPIRLPLTSLPTSAESVRSGPVAPPVASRPWQNAHCATNNAWPGGVFAGVWFACPEETGGGVTDRDEPIHKRSAETTDITDAFY